MFDLNTILPFSKTLNISVVKGSLEELELTMPIDPRIHNHIGTIHAGALFTLAEITAGGILALNFDLTKVWFVNLESRIRYHKPARTDVTGRTALGPGEADRLKTMFAEAGKLDYTHGCTLVDADENLVAEYEADFVFRPMRG